MSKIIVTGAAPPVKDPNVFWVESPKGGHSCKFRVFSPTAWGVYTHYHGSTSPCYENHKHCAHGHDPVTLRWKGYLFGWHFEKRRKAFLQLTPEAWRSIEEQLASGTTLRGLTIIARRTAANKGRMLVEVAQYMDVDPVTQPPDHDPRASLYHTWKLDDPGHKWAINPLRKADFNLFSA